MLGRNGRIGGNPYVRNAQARVLQGSRMAGRTGLGSRIGGRGALSVYAAGAVGAYGMATNYMPGAMAAGGTLAGGAIGMGLGNRYGGRRSAPGFQRSVGARMSKQGLTGSKAFRRTAGKMIGPRRAWGSAGGGIAGAAAGYMLAKMSNRFFGASTRSNRGYR